MKVRVLTLTLLAAAAGALPAAALPISATDSGWYNTDGVHIASIDTYIVGDLGGTLYRNFFVFDLSGISDEIVAATLRLYNPTSALPALQGYVSPDPTETLALYDVSTPVATLSSTFPSAPGGNPAGRDVYADLGTGSVYGLADVSAADNGRIVTVTLNPAGLAALNAARGGLFALGGALTTLGSPGSEYVFGYSVALDNPDTRVLDLTTRPGTVPEPATLALLGLGLAGAAMRQRRQSSRRPASPIGSQANR